jgi:hypothetical protein
MATLEVQIKMTLSIQHDRPVSKQPNVPVLSRKEASIGFRG